MYSSIKMSDYFEIVRPEYVYLKLTPDSSTRNYTSSQIAIMIVNFYKTFRNRVYRIERKMFVQTKVKCCYLIVLNKRCVEFYLMVPKRYVALAKEKLYAVWPKIKIQETDKSWKFSSNAVSYQLNYKYQDFMSLQTDFRTNSLLNSILNSTEVLSDGSNTVICFNLMPTNQRSWKHEYINGMDKYKQGQPVEKEIFSTATIVKSVLWVLCTVLEELINGVRDSITGITSVKMDKVSLSTVLNKVEDLSDNTRKKLTQLVLDTQIVVTSDSENKRDNAMNVHSVCQCFHTIADDNSLGFKKLQHTPAYEDFSLQGSGVNKMSVNEIQNLIQLPGRELLEAYKSIDCIKYLEQQVPEQLTKGVIRLGTNTCKDIKTEATLSTDIHKYNLGMLYVGPMGSGKTTLMTNHAIDAYKAGESVVVVEFIKNCEICSKLERVVDKKDLCVIDLSDPKQVQAFAFNEVSHLFESDCADYVAESANWQTQAIAQFINAINPEHELTGKMRRGLIAVCNVVFTYENTSLKDVVECMLNVETRNKFIDNLSPEFTELLEEDIANMRDLDMTDKDGNVSTNSKKTEFSIDRINLLMEDLKLRRMFRKPMEDNVDFVDMLDQGKVILIKIPEHTFPTKMHKNLLTTFFIQKVWIACQIRGKFSEYPRRTHFFIDELLQAPTAQLAIKDDLYQSRKFQLRFCLSVHGLAQCKPLIEPFEECGMNYMMLTGTDKASIDKFAKKLEPFTYSDFLKLDRYHSLNLIEYEGGTSCFVTKLPKAVTSL